MSLLQIVALFLFSLLGLVAVTGLWHAVAPFLRPVFSAPRRQAPRYRPRRLIAA